MFSISSDEGRVWGITAVVRTIGAHPSIEERMPCTCRVAYERSRGACVVFLYTSRVVRRLPVERGP